LQREQVRTFLIGVEFKSARLCQARPAQIGAEDETGRTVGAWWRDGSYSPFRYWSGFLKSLDFHLIFKSSPKLMQMSVIKDLAIPSAFG